jgi:hypothetical protein
LVIRVSHVLLKQGVSEHLPALGNQRHARPPTAVFCQAFHVPICEVGVRFHGNALQQRSLATAAMPIKHAKARMLIL